MDKSIILVFTLINISAFTIPVMVRLAYMLGYWLDDKIENKE